MKQRPWPIIILGILHILHPIYSLIFMAILTNQRVMDLLANMTLTWQSLQFWLLFPLGGLAIMTMKRWAYPAVFIVWTYSAYTNYQSWSKFPELLSGMALTANYLLSLAIVSYFVIPSVRAVYFNPRVRWWEQKPRYYFELPCQLVSNELQSEAVALDISEVGVFVASQIALDLQSEVKLKIRLGTAGEVELAGDVVRKDTAKQRADNGYGIAFKNLTRDQKLDLRKSLQELEKSGVARTQGSQPLAESFKNWVVNVIKHRKGLLPEIPVSLKK